MKRKFTAVLMVACAMGAARGAVAADSAGEREQSLRFPPDVAKSNPYVELNPDPDYHHASAAAYEAFRKIKYGVRVHWGLYSFLPDSRESWSFLPLSNEERQQYLDNAKKWTASHFDAEQWMQFFEASGFKCFTITTKHHEGFSLFDTHTRVHHRVNWTAPGGPQIEDCDVAFSVMETPSKRDIVRELCDAAHKHDMKIDLYFSNSDWYDADFRPYGKSPVQTASSTELKVVEERQKRPATIFPEPTAAERAEMIHRHRAQLKELLSNYGKVDMVCLDIQLGAADWPEYKKTIKELREIQPDVMFRNRGIGNYGDYYTPERTIPGGKVESPMPWMVIYPLGKNFSYDAKASDYKGAGWVVDHLVDTVAKGGIFEIGIGPDATGAFHPTAIAQLKEVGDWLKTNGEAIFNTHARDGSFWAEGDNVRYTAGDDKQHVYAILTKRPDGQVTLKGLHPAANSKVTLLGYDQPLEWKRAEDATVIDFPAAAKESFAYVLKCDSAQ
ncbi:MAG: alpha-L-fucosidase [Phycisphaerae bacterium]